MKYKTQVVRGIQRRNGLKQLQNEMMEGPSKRINLLIITCIQSLFTRMMIPGPRMKSMLTIPTISSFPIKSTYAKSGMRMELDVRLNNFIRAYLSGLTIFLIQFCAVVV